MFGQEPFITYFNPPTLLCIEIQVKFILVYIPFSNYVGVTTINLFNDTIIIEGNTISITCEVFGYPSPTVVWSKPNGGLSDRVSVSNGFSVPTGYGNVTSVKVNLIITNASRKDTGVYTCSANNSVGSDKNNATITVQCKFICNCDWASLTCM